MTAIRNYSTILAMLVCLATRGSGQGSVLPASIALDPAGRLLLAFSAMGNAGRLDIGAVLFDSAGNVISSMRVPSSAPDAAFAAAGVLVDARSITIAGSNSGTATGPDIVVMRFPHSVPGSTSAAGEISAGGEAFSLQPAYPNPVRGAATVTVSYTVAQSATVRMTLLDETGREVTVLREELQSTGKHSEQIVLGDIPAGLYFVEFRVRAERRVQRLLLLR